VPAGVESVVRLEYSVTGEDGPWNLIADDLPNNGHYQWLIPPESSLECFIKYTVMTASDTSTSKTPAAFTISDGTASIRNHQKSFNQIKIFPNPALNHISIISDDKNPEFEIRQITIHDIFGKELLVDETNGKMPCVINISYFEAGVYLVQLVFTDNAISTLKFVKK
jgi:hypothetical protein